MEKEINNQETREEQIKRNFEMYYEEVVYEFEDEDDYPEGLSSI